MPAYEFKLPDIGEGVAEGEILRWIVSEGDVVKEDQPLVEVMTDKVNVEIPSPKAGRITKVLANVGDVVKVGQSLVIFEVEGELPESVGVESESRKMEEVAAIPKSEQRTTERGVLAAPATRKLASELGVVIQDVVGTGPEGRVTTEDVKRVAATKKVSPGLSERGESSPAREERVPLRGMRKMIAEKMSKSAHTAAQVTHFDEVDATELMALRNRLNTGSEQTKRVKLTFLPLLIKAIIPALKEFPYVNALIDDERQEIVLKKYYNIGIATDTDQGLVVPVIKDADKKDIFELASEIEDLAGKARVGKLGLEEVRDSTFTITNVGSIGGLFSTPLVNYPEVAIMAIQRIAKRPVAKGDAVVIRDMMNLSLSFDHRVIDGAYAARFVNKVITMI